MKLSRLLGILAAIGLSLTIVAAQDKSTGGFKGKVQVESGSPSGVAVVVRQGDHEVARTTSDRNGEFSIQRLAPGFYGVTFRKPGLSVGTLENLEVKAGKIRALGDRLVLSIDAGSITFLRGSVFDEVGRSLPNVRVELARVLDDGSLKKLDSRVTNETGSFVFRLTPDAARYRVTAKADRRETASKDVDIDSAAVYRIALSLAVKQ
ncbi:MAG TPA: carboxypeptidase-like regulatory domain-containing protein [Pyrinomonadaceae bacterium]|nr:carboxypeptidase-like regulatory domain-containing protein [Pyrinomonadaceae bacterium]